MKAIYNKKSMLVGWYDQQNKNVFNKEMQWVGFVRDNGFFSVSARWIGGYFNGSFVDKKGKPVAWISGNVPVGTSVLLVPMTPLIPLRPLTPLRPLEPLHPLIPMTPLGGWSSLEWKDYLNS